MYAGGRYAIGLPRGLILHRVGKGVEVCVKSRSNKVCHSSNILITALMVG